LQKQKFKEEKMKKSISLFLQLLIIIVIISCNKSDNVVNPSNPGGIELIDFSPKIAPTYAKITIYGKNLNYQGKTLVYFNDYYTPYFFKSNDSIVVIFENQIPGKYKIKIVNGKDILSFKDSLELISPFNNYNFLNIKSYSLKIRNIPCYFTSLRNYEQPKTDTLYNFSGYYNNSFDLSKTIDIKSEISFNRYDEHGDVDVKMNLKFNNINPNILNLSISGRYPLNYNDEMHDELSYSIVLNNITPNLITDSTIVFNLDNDIVNKSLASLAYSYSETHFLSHGSITKKEYISKVLPVTGNAGIDIILSK